MYRYMFGDIGLPDVFVHLRVYYANLNLLLVKSLTNDKTISRYTTINTIIVSTITLVPPCGFDLTIIGE